MLYYLGGIIATILAPYINKISISMSFVCPHYENSIQANQLILVKNVTNSLQIDMNFLLFKVCYKFQTTSSSKQLITTYNIHYKFSNFFH